MNNPVVVERELLERAVSIPTKESLEANHAAIIDRGRAQAEIRVILAQPAQAGGVPDGFVLVPAEGMAEMAEALKERLIVTSAGSVLNASNALIAAIAARPA
jgi:hypothetical protein